MSSESDEGERSIEEFGTGVSEGSRVTVTAELGNTVTHSTFFPLIVQYRHDVKAHFELSLCASSFDHSVYLAY